MTSRESQDAPPVTAILGAGPGNGEAFARTLGRAGHKVALLARDNDRLAEMAASLPGAEGFACDVTDPSSVTAAFLAVEAGLGPVRNVIYNAGKGVWGDALAVSAQEFEAAWRTNAFGGFVAAQCALPGMIERGGGSFIFVGATASLRGGPQTAAFAAAKGAQRLLAQSMARAYGRHGVHVALVIIDAIVGEPLMRAKLRDRPDDFFCWPDDIAASVLHLIEQPRSAWTFELDLRPFGESW